MNTIPVRVTSTKTVAQDIRLITFESIDGSAMPNYEPGSHIDLYLGEGLIRQYSLCGPHNKFTEYCVAVKLEPQSRGGSKVVHEKLEIGSTLKISAPRNHFPMAAESRHSILIAGGIGITPLISMARALQAKGESYQLVYFCRTPDHAAFRDELESERFVEHSQMFYGLERDAVTNVLRKILEQRSEHSHLYTCGPSPFMDTVRNVADELGWPEDAVHFEYFAAAPQETSGTDESFEVHLAKTGLTVQVAPDTTIIDVLRENGVEVETSCEQGVCGTCVTGVLEGTPDHRDCFLTKNEKAAGQCMAICISRSKSLRLVLDL